MAGKSDRQALKLAAMLSLDRARAGMQRDLHAAREQLNPAAFFQQSVKKHRIGIMVGAAVAGFAVIKFLMPSHENRRDTLPKSAKKRTLMSFLLAGIWGVAREPLLGLATQQLLPIAMQYISHFNPPSQSPKPQ